MEKVDEDASLEFKWLKRRGFGGKKKEIQFYESFIYDGVKYMLYDCVYMYKEGLREPYIGKLIKIWELRDSKTKKVKVQWFFRPEEISKWLGDTTTLENEIFFASGEGVGLANINPLEAIAGQCNVVCVSKDRRNPQPSDEELKVADFIFYRTFDVQSCSILDKMEEKVGGLGIEYIFNRKEGENTSTLPQSISDRKEENQNTTTCGEVHQLLTKSLTNKLKDDKEDIKLSAEVEVKVDAKGESQGKDIPNLLAENDSCILKADKDNSRLKDMPFSKDKAGKDEMKTSMVPIHKVEAKERNKPPTGSDKLHDRPLKKIMPDDKNPSKEKQVELEVAGDSDRLKDMPSKKSEVEKSIKLPVNKLKALGTTGSSSEMGKTDSCIDKADEDNSKLKDMPCNKDKDERKVSIVPVHEVEAKERNKTPTGNDKLHDRPLKKMKSNDKAVPKEKQVELEVARDSERLKDMPSKKSKVENSSKLPVDSNSKHEEKLPLHVKDLKDSETSGTNSEMGKSDRCTVKADKDNSKQKNMPCSKDKDEMEESTLPVHKVEAKEKNKTPAGSDNLHDRPLKKIKSNDKTTLKEIQVEVQADGDSERLTNSIKPHGKNGKVLLESDKGKSSTKVTDDLEGRMLNKTRTDGSFKMPDNKKNNSVQKLSIDTSGSNGKDLVDKQPKVEQSVESKRRLSMSKSPKVSGLSTDRDKKTIYQEFVVGPKPNADRSGWFRRLPWEERLKNAYDQGTAVLLYNVDPNYTSGEVEDIIWHALTENCEAKILQRTAVSSPHYGQALILLKTKEAAQRVLAKLDEECLMLSNGRPLVAITCPPILVRKNSNFFGHLAIDKLKLQNQREMDEAVSTSHFSQPNTIEYDMAMEWSLLQSRSKKWWEMIHKQQGDELRKVKTALVKK
ncbi:protein ANTI-SILENCING 1 isoform X2 [Cynara cardunculus var. scolymus]|nr:protein ANTI-SILENCING 1 isoform X2 [Cynara cardunculus var. scolymus]XP_024985703.1 protein ANTI-SILENCING 1 isoform X2 [Cynara cardunculus var. scolymus]